MPNPWDVLANAPEQEEETTGNTSSAGKQAGSNGGSRSKQQQPKKRIKDPLFWLDLEMTGLDLEQDTIIEIACLVSDGDLTTIVEGPDIAIHHPEPVLAGMNAWCVEHHGKSGLTERCRASGVPLELAEQQVLDFLAQHADPGRALLAGNSVHVDMAFLKRRMPRLASHLHYRIVDVSTVKELAKRWFPRQFAGAPKKMLAHTAMSDVLESIEELRYYRGAVFRETQQQRQQQGGGEAGNRRPNKGH